MSKRWSAEDIKFLEKNYNSPYSDLVSALHRSSRSLKHKIGELGLSRDERKKYSKEEIKYIKEHPWEWSKDITKVLGRSEISIARIKRKLLGSANPRFKNGWDKPSKELAYFLGAICSDLGVYATHIAITQMYSNAEMIDYLVEIIPKIFGLVPHKSLHKVDVNGVLTDYSQLTVSSNQFLKCLGTEEGIACGNIRGSSGEWIDFIINKFLWVFDDRFFWYYFGGLYDGDGCLARKKSSSMSCGIWHAVSIGITPENSRRKIISALDSRGFNFVEETDRGKCYQIILRGSQADADRFLGLIKSRITRKRVK